MIAQQSMTSGGALGAKIGDDLKQRMIDAMRKKATPTLNPLIASKADHHGPKKRYAKVC
jgi:hypothetical protein